MNLDAIEKGIVAKRTKKNLTLYIYFLTEITIIITSLGTLSYGNGSVAYFKLAIQHPKSDRKRWNWNKLIPSYNWLKILLEIFIRTVQN